MEYNKLRYLQNVKHIQELVQFKMDRYAFISYKEIWRKLYEEKEFFLSYKTFLKYINEPQVKTRIAELGEQELKTKN